MLEDMLPICRSPIHMKVSNILPSSILNYADMSVLAGTYVRIINRPLLVLYAHRTFYFRTFTL